VKERRKKEKRARDPFFLKKKRTRGRARGVRRTREFRFHKV
jgi:hypothetical protein